MNKLTVDILKSIIDNASNKIIITTHKSPDGDAIGSSLGLYFYLKNFINDVHIIVPDEYPSFLNWMPESNAIKIFEHTPTACEQLINESTHLFALDYNSLKRIGNISTPFASSNAQKIVIDHHQQPDDFADFYYVDDTCCSTAQLVVELIEEMQHLHYINKEAANCLYTGIMMDTGSFKFPSTTFKTHQIIADLIKAGAENALIHQLVYDTSSYDRLQLLGYALFKKMNYFKTYNASLIYLDKEELARFNYQKGDTEGLVNYPLSVKEIKLSAFFSEKDGMIKCSFRSKGTFDVNQFARSHFNGGGHKNAAGGILNCSMDEAVELYKNTIKEYKKELV
jgi:phosphoesterase RecJ-like protein